MKPQRILWLSTPFKMRLEIFIRCIKKSLFRAQNFITLLILNFVQRRKWNLTATEYFIKSVEIVLINKQLNFHRAGFKRRNILFY